MHLNEVERILKDTIQKKENYLLRKYCDHICCNSDFVLLNNGFEFAYIKFDERGNMTRKEMNINEEKMGAARFYVVVKDSDEFIPTNLPCRVFPRNDMKHPLDCLTDDLLEKLESLQPINSRKMPIEAIADFFEKSLSSLIRGRMQAFISEIREVENLSDVIEDHDSYFMFTPQYERLFFCSLLGSTSGMPKRVCRYTSLSSLFRTLSESQQSMCSVVCMNDRSETDYAKQFISNVINHSNVFQRLNARTNANRSNSNYFILSGSRMGKKDDLNMWRLYGDGSKGVCLWYEVGEMSDNFFIAKVSYAKNNTHAELNYLSNKLSKNVCGRNFEIRNLESWLHFFKPAEYVVEEETRLLFEMNDTMLLETYNGKWILNSDNNIIAPIVSFPIGKKNNQFPLTLNKIVLGPNCPEKELNKGQLQLMIQQKQIETTADFEITTSNIRMKEKNLDEYLAEIGKAELLTIDEELELVKAVQEKGVESEEMTRLEKANARFVVSVANQYQNKGLTIWELIEAGTDGLRKAAMKYDRKNDFKFMPYAVWWVRQSILQAINEKK